LTQTRDKREGSESSLKLSDIRFAVSLSYFYASRPPKAACLISELLKGQCFARLAEAGNELDIEQNVSSNYGSSHCDFRNERAVKKRTVHARRLRCLYCPIDCLSEVFL
jgi:hypothetical protein